MGGRQDGRQGPGGHPAEPVRDRGCGPDPVHPEFGRTSRDPDRDDPARRRADDPQREQDQRDEEL